jgi:hypothetical protein
MIPTPALRAEQEEQKTQVIVPFSIIERTNITFLMQNASSQPVNFDRSFATYPINNSESSFG